MSKIHQTAIEILEARKSNLDFAYEKYVINGNANANGESAINNRLAVISLEASIYALKEMQSTFSSPLNSDDNIKNILP